MKSPCPNRIKEALSRNELLNASIDQLSSLEFGQTRNSMCCFCQIICQASTTEDELMCDCLLDQFRLADLLGLGNLAHEIAKPLISESKGKSPFTPSRRPRHGDYGAPLSV